MKSMEEVYSSKGYKKLGWLNFLGFHQRAIESIIRDCVPLQEGEKILDAGCGYGLVSRAVENEVKAKGIGIDLYGFDISTSMPAAYRSYVSIPAKLSCMDASSLSYKNDYFDTIICAGLFEHIQDPEVVISEYVRCLKPKGNLIIFVSNNNIIVQSMISIFGNAVGTSYEAFKPYLEHPDIVDVQRVYFKGIHFWSNLFNFAIRCRVK